MLHYSKYLSVSLKINNFKIKHLRIMVAGISGHSASCFVLRFKSYDDVRVLKSIFEEKRSVSMACRLGVYQFNIDIRI